MRPRLTRPIAEINSPLRVQEARSRVLCALRNVRRPPGAEPCRPKPEGCWTALPFRGRSPGQPALPPPQRIAGSYTSFQPLGVRPRSSLGCTLLPLCCSSALPHDHRVRNASPGQAHPASMAGNSPVSSHGCKSPLPVADGVAGKPSFNASGRKTYFRYSSQGCIRARLHPGPHQPAIRRMDRGLRPVAPHRDLELIWNGVVDTSGGRR